jgi:hypothetical protein
MLNRLDWAEFVLLICTPTYYRRFRGHEEPGKGKGVDWEGAIITDAIYDARSATLEFVPVLFDPADQKAIPEPVRGHRFYCLSSATDYQHLYDFLLGQSGIEPRPLGQLKLKARDRAAPLTFPDAEPKPLAETATTPAQLWPDDTSATGTVEGTTCYARLLTLCAGGEMPDAQERRALWQAVKKDHPSSFLAWQLGTIARWGTTEYLEVDEHFTPLQVQVRVRARDEEPGEKQQRPCDTLAEAMAAVFEEYLAPASVLFAPPGGGKSTLLRHYQLQQARRLADSERLMLYVQLRDYRPDKLADEDRATDLPALAWLACEWRKETGQAPPLIAFLGQGSTKSPATATTPTGSGSGNGGIWSRWSIATTPVCSCSSPAVRWTTPSAWTPVATRACPRSRCSPWSPSVSGPSSTSASHARSPSRCGHSSKTDRP